MIEVQREQVHFKDLSTDLKVLVVGGWIVVGLNLFAFVVGFVIGMSG